MKKINKLKKVSFMNSGKINEQKEYFTKETETLQKSQTQILKQKKLTNKIKKLLGSTGNRADHMKERITVLDDRNLEMIQVDEEWELRFAFFFFNEQTPWELPNSIRKSNVTVMGIPGGEEKEKEADSLFKKGNSWDHSNPGEGTGYSRP